MSTERTRRGRPPKSDGPSTRERLLDAALELFARQGYAATTVRQIAAAVGVRDSAIYAHFSGKQAIYDALFERMGPVDLAELGIDLAGLGAAEPSDAVRQLVTTLIDAWSAPKARLFADVVLREGRGADGRGGLVESVDLALKRMQAPFRHWQATGRLSDAFPPKQLAWELFSPLHVIRFLHLRADATEADLATARRQAIAHAAFFLACTRPDERT